MKAKKYYAVRRGRIKGIYFDWQDCKSQVEGFEGADYKSFKSVEEANEYILYEYASEKNTYEDIEAYVDGSYNNTKKCYGSGVIILENGEIKKTFSVKGDDKNLASMRNVAGEMVAAKIAMDYCVKNKVKSLTIYFDYEGIEKWCTGEWKTNKQGTIEYKKYYDTIKNDIKVIFVKVKAHSGNKYNEEADILAKKSVGII